MDEKEMKQISRENFAEISSEKISKILCFPGNNSIHKWAVKLLQRAARGFGSGEHEPWIGALNLLQCSRVILSNYKPHIRKPNLDVQTLSSALPHLLKSPLQLDCFISELVTLFLNRNEVPSEEKLVINVFSGSGIPVGGLSSGNAKPTAEEINAVKTKYDIGSGVSKNLATRDLVTDTSSDSLPIKRRNISDNNPVLEDKKDVKDFFQNVWIWARKGNIKLEPKILGELLTYLPECVEEVVIDIALTLIKSRTSTTNYGKAEGEGEIPFGGEAVYSKETATRIGDNEAIIVDSLLRDSAIFIDAVSVSQKLFQITSSVLNQLQILSAGCSCSWSPMLSLSTTFAKETAKGRANFYPISLQSTVLLMEADPQTPGIENYKEDVIVNHLKTVVRTHPAEAIVALISHFPAWLQFIDPISFLCHK